MERVQVLIDKLIEQKRLNESPSQLLITVQLLQTELQNLHQKKNNLGTSKVSVVMPNNTVMSRHAEEKVVEQPKVQPANNDYRFMPKETIKNDNKVEEVKEEKKQEQYTINKPVVEEVKKTEPEILKTPEKEIKFQQQSFFDQHDIISESPTFIQHQPQKEIHELITDMKESLNDRLKEDKKELAHTLKDTPVKDLRKAIGINDKFLFLNELFRGDEAMYERSIKTINGFGILSEAEYWINRELKVKLGWNDNKDTVQHFYHLVRRRFS